MGLLNGLDVDEGAPGVERGTSPVDVCAKCFRFGLALSPFHVFFSFIELGIFKMAANAEPAANAQQATAKVSDIVKSYRASKVRGNFLRQMSL